MILARGLQFSSGLDPQLERFLSKWVFSVRAYLVTGHIQKYNTGIFELYLDRKFKKKAKLAIRIRDNGYSINFFEKFNSRISIYICT